MNSSLQLTGRAADVVNRLAAFSSFRRRLENEEVVGGFFKQLMKCPSVEAVIGLLHEIPVIIRSTAISETEELLKFLIALTSHQQYHEKMMNLANRIFGEDLPEKPRRRDGGNTGHCLGHRCEPRLDILHVLFCAHVGHRANKEARKMLVNAIERQWVIPGVDDGGENDSWPARTEIHELIIEALCKTFQINQLLNVRYKPIIPAFKKFVSDRLVQNDSPALSKVLNSDDTAFIKVLQQQIEIVRNHLMQYDFPWQDLEVLLYLMKICRD